MSNSKFMRFAVCNVGLVDVNLYDLTRTIFSSGLLSFSSSGKSIVV